MRAGDRDEAKSDDGTGRDGTGRDGTVIRCVDDARGVVATRCTKENDIVCGGIFNDRRASRVDVEHERDASKNPHRRMVFGR